MTTVAAAVMSLGIGVLLGLFGGGGSVLALPMLVWVAGVPTGEAVPLSLAIVGATSALAAWEHGRSDHVDGGVVWRFGSASVLGAIVGARATSLVSDRVLLLAFAALMVIVGSVMLARRSERKPKQRSAGIGPRSLAALGAGVGVLTGFLGVGGGFLIVPALSMGAGLPMHVAVGTSLVVIAASAASGLASHLVSTVPNLSYVLLFTAAALAGAFVGERVSERVPAERLRRGFAAFVVLVGIAVGAAVAGGAKLPGS